MTIQKVRDGHAYQFDSSDWATVEQYSWRIKPDCNYVMSFMCIGPNKAKTLYMHRVLLGVTDRHTLVDHINGNPLDNRRSNLRIASYRQNTHNQKAKKHRPKGVIYVYYKGTKFIAGRITVDGRQIHLGGFATEAEAGAAYNEAAKKYFGEFASLNP